MIMVLSRWKNGTRSRTSTRSSAAKSDRRKTESCISALECFIEMVIPPCDLKALEALI